MNKRYYKRLETSLINCQMSHYSLYPYSPAFAGRIVGDVVVVVVALQVALAVAVGPQF